MNTLDGALVSTDETLAVVMKKAKFWEPHATSSFNESQTPILNKLLDGFEGKLTSTEWAKIAKCSSNTAVRDINDLLQNNVLNKEAAGGRSTNYGLKME